MSMLRYDKVIRISDYESMAVDDYYFEVAVCDHIAELEVCYQNVNQPESLCKFVFEDRVNLKVSEPAKKLKMGVLYHLRPCHPVVDAVAYVYDQDGKPWLLLIQMSIFTYSSCKFDYRSEVKRLLQKPSGCEVVCDKQSVNWIQYYRHCVDKEVQGDVNVMYIILYLSPQEFIETGELADTLKKFRVLSHLTDFFFGLVMKSSKSASFVSQFV